MKTGKSEKDAIEEFGRRAGLPCYRKMSGLLVNYIQKTYPDEVDMNMTTNGTLLTKDKVLFLKENNITSRVATSTAKETAIRMLKNTKLYDYFEKIIYGDEIKNSKPAPDIYLKALEGFDKDEALIFEDSHNGSRAAINAGIKLIIVPNIAKLTKEDKEEAFKVINSLDETINTIKDINKIK